MISKSSVPETPKDEPKRLLRNYYPTAFIFLLVCFNSKNNVISHFELKYKVVVFFIYKKMHHLCVESDLFSHQCLGFLQNWDEE